MRELLKFPPVAFFTIITLVGIAINVAAIFEENVFETNMQKLYLLSPSAEVSSFEATKPCRISVMVTTNSAEDYSGWIALVYVYSPDGRLYDVRSEVIDSTGTATIDFWFGILAQDGNYTLIPAAGFSSSYLVFGEPVFVTLRGG